MELVQIVLWATLAIAGNQKPLGEVDFFGSKGFDVEAIRSALPFHEADPFPPAKAKSSDDLKRQVSEKVKQIIGREPTDISFVCCDSKQRWMVYIGLPGESYQTLAFNATPAGDVRFPKAAIQLSRKMGNALTNAVMHGHSTEDDSRGFTLTNDPAARKAELALRDFALQNEALILQILASSSDAKHRAIAAQMLGYGRQSGEQIDALVKASLDTDDTVRNNAVRALWVLAGAKPDLAKRVPLEPFIRLLSSGDWSDHNKASLVLVALTKTREPKTLERIRAEALDPLMEMARWRSIGHAGAALTILGRIAGIDEDKLDKLIESGEAGSIINKFAARSGPWP